MPSPDAVYIPSIRELEALDPIRPEMAQALFSDLMIFNFMPRTFVFGYVSEKDRLFFVKADQIVRYGPRQWGATKAQWDKCAAISRRGTGQGNRLW